MKDRLYLYPLWIRSWHLLNALSILTLIISGLSLQYSDSSINFIPFNTAIYIHDIAGIAIVILYLAYFVGNITSSNSIHYKFKAKGFGNRMLKQLIYYSYGIFKKQRPPFPITATNKFNPLQKVCYLLAMYVLMPILILSGLALLFPEYIPEKICFQSGLQFTDLVHIITGFPTSMFLIIHVYLCTLGKTPSEHFKSMVNGWH